MSKPQFLSGNKSYLKYRILGFSFGGDAKNQKTWSGTNYYFYRALKKRCDVVGIIDNMSNRPNRMLKLFRKKYPRLNRRFVLSLLDSDKKACKKILKKKIQKVRKPYDLILHLNFVPSIKHNVPFVIYADVAMQRCYTYYKDASVIFTFSEYAKKSILKYCKIDPCKIIPVGAGTNLTRLPEVDKQYDGKTILFVGSDVLRKGGLILLKAFKKVKEKIPDARLIMISSQLKKLSRGRREKNLERFGIFIKGFADKRVLGFWYRRASVFVMPSMHEAFGIVFLEAMVYKLPCIGTDRCAMPEIIENGKTGFLVRPYDPDCLADKIIFLLKHKEIARQMGERGRQRVVEYYNWDSVVERILKKIGPIISIQKND